MIGQTIGAFKIEQKIGEGGMGAVFKGRDLMLEREVAIKALRPELARQPELVARFRTEAVTLAKLNHSHIATLYNFLCHGEDYFMIMEYVRGRSLGEIIHQSGAIETERSLRLFCQALEGISHAHSLGVIHRDIKPANIMLAANDEVKVMDFGIARVLGSARQTKTGRLIGTLEYMSPEQMRGAETDARSDIYSLGILLYEMLTGRVPFQADSDYELIRAQVENDPPPPREFKADLPLAVEAAIMRALAKDPAVRFESAAEFRQALINAVPAAAFKPVANIQTITEPAIKATRVADGAKDASLENKSIPRRNSGFDSTTGTFTLKLPSGFLAVRQTLEAKIGPLNWKRYSSAAAALLLFAFGFSVLRNHGNDQAQTNRTEISPAPVMPTSAPLTDVPTPVTTPVPALNSLPEMVGPSPASTKAIMAEEKSQRRANITEEKSQRPAKPLLADKPSPVPLQSSNNSQTQSTPKPTQVYAAAAVNPTPVPEKPGKANKTLDVIGKGAETAGKVGNAVKSIIGLAKKK